MSTMFQFADPALHQIADAAIAAGFTKLEVEAGVARYKRSLRITNPAGHFDNAGRFYLDEHCECCNSIRAPSRAHPFSQMVHGRTIVHLAQRYGVSQQAIRCVSGALDASGSKEPHLIARKLRAGGIALARQRLESATSAHEKMVAAAKLAALQTARKAAQKKAA